MPDLILERRDQANETLQAGPVAIAPKLGESYWAYRVLLSERQAIVGFPKFNTIGIGYAVEDADWNTNLPYTCDTNQILEHIAENKGDDSISDTDVRAAIVMVQEAAKADRAAAPAAVGSAVSEPPAADIDRDDIRGIAAAAIAADWMRHIGFTDEQIAEAETVSCRDAGCEPVAVAFDDGCSATAYDCTGEDGKSRHPVADELAAAVEMANVAIEALEGRGWKSGQDVAVLEAVHAGELATWRGMYRVAADRSEAAVDRVAELEAFVADIASHGLRCDLNPTVNSAGDMYTQITDYLRRVNTDLRDRARALVPDANVPYSGGRPASEEARR